MQKYKYYLFFGFTVSFLCNFSAIKIVSLLSKKIFTEIVKKKNNFTFIKNIKNYFSRQFIRDNLNKVFNFNSSKSICYFEELKLKIYSASRVELITYFPSKKWFYRKEVNQIIDEKKIFGYVFRKEKYREVEKLDKAKVWLFSWAMLLTSWKGKDALFDSIEKDFSKKICNKCKGKNLADLK